MTSNPSELAEVISDALQEAGYDAWAVGNVVNGRDGRTRVLVKSDNSVVIEREKDPGDIESMFKKSRLTFIKIRGRLYDVHGLDVWGNEEDGFEVNDIFPSMGKVEIPTDASDADIVRILKEDGYIDADVKRSNVEIEGDEYGYDVSDKNGQPVYQLRGH